MSIEVALSKLRSAQICHPNAVQFLIDEAITAIQQAGAKTDVRCEGCGYMTHHREHMGCVRAAKQFTHPAPGVPDDSKRLDYLQDRGATIDLIPGVAGFYPMKFRVGGLRSSANTNVRAAIDAAMLAAQERP